MIRGVSFRVPRSENILGKIFKCMKVEQYCWFNILNQNEVWANYDGGIGLEKEYYKGKCFAEILTSEYFIIFIKLEAFFEDGDFFNIHTYEEFQRSDCQILLLICDCDFVDIYVKDELLSKGLYENALLNNCTEVRYITEGDDRRTRMDVL